MKKQSWRVLSFVLILAFILSISVFATMDASDYLSFYNAYISRTGNTVTVNFEVEGTRIMDYIGVTEIYLYERANSMSSWSLVKTFLSTDSVYATSMISSNTSLKLDSVSYSGSSSKQYMAYVTCYAEKNGGSDSRTLVIYS